MVTTSPYVTNKPPLHSCGFFLRFPHPQCTALDSFVEQLLFFNKHCGFPTRFSPRQVTSSESNLRGRMCCISQSRALLSRMTPVPCQQVPCHLRRLRNEDSFFKGVIELDVGKMLCNMETYTSNLN
jgi:hypothetical protein